MKPEVCTLISVHEMEIFKILNQYNLKLSIVEEYRGLLIPCCIGAVTDLCKSNEMGELVQGFLRLKSRLLFAFDFSFLVNALLTSLCL